MDDIRPYQEQNCNNFWCTWVKWEAGSWSPNQTYLHLKIFCENSNESKSIYQVQGIKVKRWKLTHKHRDQQKMHSYKCQPTNVAIRQAQMSTLFPHLVQVVLSPRWSDRQVGRSDTNVWVCLKRLPNRWFSEFWSRGSGGGRNFRPPVSAPINSDGVNFDRQAEHRLLFTPLIAWDQEAPTKQLVLMSY